MKNKRQKNIIKSKRTLSNILLRSDKKWYVSVFRSQKYLYASIRDVKTKKTLYGMSDKQIDKEKKLDKKTRTRQLGLLFAKKMLENKHTDVAFHRGSYSYLGRVKEFVEGLREGGIQI